MSSISLTKAAVATIVLARSSSNNVSPAPSAPGSPAPHRWPPGSASLPGPAGSSAVTGPPGPRGDHPPPPTAEPPDGDQRIHPGHPQRTRRPRDSLLRACPSPHSFHPDGNSVVPHSPGGPTQQPPGRARTQSESPVRSLNVNSEEDLATHRPPPSTVLPHRTWDRQERSSCDAC
jgi:hypothetical protein